MTRASVVRLPSPGQPLGDAVDYFLADRDLATSTRRVYGVALGTLVADVDRDTDICVISARLLASHLHHHYATAPPSPGTRWWPPWARSSPTANASNG